MTDLARFARRHGAALGLAALALLLVVLAIHTLGVVLDWRAVLANPFERDYGEGIVWQQAKRIPGPDAYLPMTKTLPFIVFHYPPVYYLLTRATWTVFHLDELLAGRIVSLICTILLVFAMIALVLLAARRQPGRRHARIVAIAIAAGLIPLCLHALRSWGVVMRVDMPSLLLPLVATFVAARARGAFAGTLLAFFLCLLAVFSKQTAVYASLTIFLMALWQRPGNAIRAAAIVGAVGIAAAGWIQLRTGGFLWNIVAANVNPFGLRYGLLALHYETRGAPVYVLSLFAAAAVLLGLLPHRREGWSGIVRDLRALRTADVATTCRALLVLQFVATAFALSAIFKHGAAYNYVLLWVPVACILIGVWLTDLAAAADAREGAAGLVLAPILLVLVATMAIQRFRFEIDNPPPDPQWQVVARIKAADKPVVSENMTLLMRAGKPVIFEPAILIDLIQQGRWDERALLDMLRQHRFAFLILNNATVPPGMRTPGMEAAYQRYYPRLEQVAPGLWMRSPG